MTTKIIEIHCCFECPYESDRQCTVMERPVEELGELCPPPWCPLEDAIEEPNQVCGHEGSYVDTGGWRCPKCGANKFST